MKSTLYQCTVYLIFLGIFQFSSCKIINDGVTELTYSGTVFNSEYKPISGIEIRKGRSTLAKSGKEGKFLISKNKLNVGDVLTFEGEGYVKSVKVFQKNTKLYIFLKKLGETKTMNATKGANLEFDSGVKLNVPANAFQLNNTNYKGEVKLGVTNFDVQNSRDLQSAPAAFIAQAPGQGNRVPLTSFGIVEITAMTPRNEPLTLNKGVGLKIEFPTRVEGAPAQINFYELNYITGYWELQGTVSNVGNVLQGVVTTVNSAWNADEPCADALVCIKVRILTAAGAPASCLARVEGVSYNGFDGIYSPDANGDVEFFVCPGEVFELGACYIFCCGPGVPLTDPCCNNPQFRTTIDMSTIPLNPSGCTDIGVWNLPI